MSDRDLQLSYWLISSRPFVRRAALGAFIVIDLALLALVTILGVRFGKSSQGQVELFTRLAGNQVQYAQVNEGLKPPPLAVAQTAILSGSGGAYTLVALAKNPSDRWALESVHFSFVLDQQEIGSGDASFQPAEERPLVVFGAQLARVSANSAIQMVFSSQRWRRIFGPDDLPRLKLTVANPAYHILSSIPGNQLSQVTAVLTNREVVTLPTIEATALLLNGTAIVGAARLSLTELKGLEQRSVDLRLYQAVAVTGVRFFATVDVKDLEAWSGD